MDERYDVIGSRVTRANTRSALDAVVERLRAGEGGYVCFTNVHAVVVARQDPSFRSVINDSFMSLPDGKPIYWIGRLRRAGPVRQVAGPEFFTTLLSQRQTPPLRHYFYGSRPEVLSALVGRLRSRFPDVDIVGAASPAFRELSAEEKASEIDRIKASGADIIWVALGAPKQERWMAENWRALRPAVLLGVGAAFDIHAGAVARAPAWMRRVGLEWLFRLVQEPRRLWKRYAYTNSMFLCYLLMDLARATPRQAKRAS